MTLVGVGLFFAQIYGLPSVVYEKDASFLSLVTFAVFCVSSASCGAGIWRYYRLTHDLMFVRRLRETEEKGWFASELCLNLGMLGTIVGFVMMLSGFEGVNINDQASVQKLLSELGKSMATALYTTLVGLACGQLLKMQYFLLSSCVQDAERALGIDEDK